MFQIPEAESSIQDIAVDQDGSYMAAVNNKGHCYIWTLTGGIGEEPTRLNPRRKLLAQTLRSSLHSVPIQRERLFILFYDGHLKHYIICLLHNLIV